MSQVNKFLQKLIDLFVYQFGAEDKINYCHHATPFQKNCLTNLFVF